MKDYSAYITAHIKRNLCEREALESHRARVIEQLNRIAPSWAQKYGVMRVLLFGSFAAGTHRLNSDVDVAVEGLRGEDYWKAWADIENLSGLEIDLRCLEDFPPSSRALILKNGVVIYEKGTSPDADR
jgi:predicted nucleotidyltransferase